AGGVDGSVEQGRDVGPDDDLAAGAVAGRRGVDGGGSVDRDRAGGRDRLVLEPRARIVHEAQARVAARPVAADEDRAAAGRAGHVDARAGDLDVLAGDDHPAAFAAAIALAVLALHGLGRGRDGAGETDGLLRRADALGGGRGGAEHDGAAVAADAVRLDHAGVVDHRIDHLARGRRGELDAAA